MTSYLYLDFGFVGPLMADYNIAMDPAGWNNTIIDNNYHVNCKCLLNQIYGLLDEQDDY